MKKLYYDCAIQALYMAKYFGVLIDFDLPELDNEEKEKQMLNFGKLLEVKRLYVNPKSYNIFEPKEKDKGQCPRKVLCEFEKRKYSNEVESGFFKTWIPLEQLTNDWIWEDNEIEIIMRKNKQFFMPQEENEKSI